MRTTRRLILSAVARSALVRSLTALIPTSAKSAAPLNFDVDRLLGDSGDSHSEIRSWTRRYTASATVMLFSLPIVTKKRVGNGFASVEEAGNTTSIQFGAGSCPQEARGFNRLGFIHEALLSDAEGRLSRCAWLAFMTTSAEKSVEDAQKSMVSESAEIPYSASQGIAKAGLVCSRVDRLKFPSQLTWKDAPRLLASAREAMRTTATPLTEKAISVPPATFLATLRGAILSGEIRTHSTYVFNGKQFALNTAKSIAAPGQSTVCLNATVTNPTGEKNSFRLWYERGAEHQPPLRFEYQAKSFLRLVFEADPSAPLPPVPLALSPAKENA